MAFRMFVFGESLAAALEAIPEESQLKFYRMVKDYGLHGMEPDLTGFEKATWVQMKAMIDLTIPKRNNASPVGKRGAPFGNTNAQKTKNNSNNSPELFSEPPATPENTDPENNSNTIQTIHTIQLNVNDNVNVNDNDLSGSSEPPPKKPKPKKPPLRERDPENDMELVEKAYILNWADLYSQHRVQTPDPVVNYTQTRKLLKNHFVKLRPEQIIQAINNGLKDDFIMSGGYSLGTMLSSSVLNRLINTSSVSRHQQEKITLE